jgi:hypothetical protein
MIKNLLKKPFVKNLLYVLAAIGLTVLTLFYQENTGPTYPKKINTNINGEAYHFELPRSQDLKFKSIIQLPVTDQTVKARINYKRYPSNDEFTTAEFVRNGDTLQFELPAQPPAGKLQYGITAYTDSEEVALLPDEGVVTIRFKGHVPIWVLRIHIFLMFASYFFAIYAGLLAITNHKNYKLWALVALVVLGVGGLILGPIVQKYAFDVWWSGVPLGWDLTDNKLLIGFIGWLVAVLVNRKENRRWWVVGAMVLQLIVYSIPHSTMGSELDYESGKVGTSEKFKD